ncbi:hypothetical protein GH714_006997 [Hevea brasiliensis]|uniref:DYW domain-containing protein n=1 Tax=Hevea brasiliensis TaxID=3981 RepID=A0A6A6M8Z9_HEVBR|nr:hypothetical protein GH714_006997 [Hevea brasiliensis]
MVDLLHCSGLLDDAYNLVKSMPMKPNSGVWGALIGACGVCGNIELGKEVAEQLIALDPSDWSMDGCFEEIVLHNVGEDVKEDPINKHSEKLAIAFGLLVTNLNMPLIITAVQNSYH